MHFLVKLVRAAPASFFSVACASQATSGLVASATHLFVKLVLAAPASFFSSACVSHLSRAMLADSALHFFRKLVLAAPASFLSAACASQVVAAQPATGKAAARARTRIEASFCMAAPSAWVVDCDARTAFQP